MNKKAQLDEFSIVGLIFGLIGGMIGIYMVSRMEGGFLLKILSFVITGIVCYFIGGRIADG